MSDLDNLSIKDIRLLADLPGIRSIRSLAEQTNQSAAALSKRIKTIEEKLQSTLVSRSSLGITITQHGNQYSLWARGIIQNLNNSRPFDIEQQQSFEKYLTIGTRGFLNKSLAPIFLESFQGDVGLKFLDLSPNDSINLKRNGQLDIGIEFGQTNFGDNWKAEKIGTLKWALMANYHSPLNSPITLEDLKNYQVIFATYWDGTSVIDGEDFLNIPKAYKNKGHGVQSAATAISIAKNSEALIYIPLIAAESELIEKKLKPIQIEGQEYHEQDLYLHINIDTVEYSHYLELVKHLEQKLSYLNNQGNLFQ